MAGSTPSKLHTRPSVGVCPANLVGHRANPCLWPATPNAVEEEKSGIPNPCSRKQSVTLLAPVFAAGPGTGRIPALRRASDRYLTPLRGRKQGSARARGANPELPPAQVPGGQGQRPSPPVLHFALPWLWCRLPCAGGRQLSRGQAPTGKSPLETWRRPGTHLSNQRKEERNKLRPPFFLADLLMCLSAGHARAAVGRGQAEPGLHLGALLHLVPVKVLPVAGAQCRGAPTIGWASPDWKIPTRNLAPPRRPPVHSKK